MHNFVFLSAIFMVEKKGPQNKEEKRKGEGENDLYSFYFNGNGYRFTPNLLLIPSLRMNAGCILLGGCCLL